MPAFSTIIAGIGLAASVAGTVVASEAAEDQSKASKKAEKARQQQANLEAVRRRREIIRQQQLARAQALSVATAQGAQFGSGLAGAYGQIGGQVNSALLGVNQNQELGNRVFNANAQYADASSQLATGSGLRSLGGQLVNNAESLGRIGVYTFGKLS